MLAFLEHEGVRIVQTPFRAPDCNAHAEQCVGSIKEECLERMILLGESHAVVKRFRPETTGALAIADSVADGSPRDRERREDVA